MTRTRSVCFKRCASTESAGAPAHGQSFEQFEHAAQAVDQAHDDKQNCHFSESQHRKCEPAFHSHSAPAFRPQPPQWQSAPQLFESQPPLQPSSVTAPGAHSPSVVHAA